MTTRTRPAATTQNHPLARLARRRPLTSYIALAFAISWALVLPMTRSTNIGVGLLPYALPDALGLLLYVLASLVGPTVAALIVAGLAEGRPGVAALLRPIVRWRVRPHWYLAALLAILMLLINGLALFLVGGVLNGEEIGWRGFALPSLQARHSALVASLIVGLVWALFHLPLFFVNGDAFASTPPLAFLARMLALAVLFTWIANNTRGSLLIAYLLHAALNTWTRIIPIAGMVGVYAWVPAGVTVLVAVVVVIGYGPARLSLQRRLP